MEAIKKSEKVEFDVIYADGTRHRVREGVLYDPKNKDMFFNTETAKLADLIDIAAATVDFIGRLNLNDSAKYYVGYQTTKGLYGLKDIDVEMGEKEGGAEQWHINRK